MSHRGRFPHRAPGRRHPRHAGSPFGGPGGPGDDHMFGDIAFGGGWSDEDSSDEDLDGHFPIARGPHMGPAPRYATRVPRGGFGGPNPRFGDPFDDSDNEDVGPPPGAPFGPHVQRGGFGGPPGVGPAMMGSSGMGRGGFGPMGPAPQGVEHRSGRLRRGRRGPRHFM